MNLSYPSQAEGTRGAAVGRARQSNSWVVSLTGICLLFGGLLALQLRAMERMRSNDQRQQAGQQEQAMAVARMQKQIVSEKARTGTLLHQVNTLSGAIAASKGLNRATTAKLGAQLKQLQMICGLVAVSGRGVRVVLTDNPDAAKNAGGNPWVAGIVHDYDLLQIVNELRGAKAEAIAVKGTRITGYTPIRCVGPTILVNFNPVTPPFVIEAIGDPDVLMPALRLPNGIVDNLKNQAGLGVELERVSHLVLPASESMPRMQIARPLPTPVPHSAQRTKGGHADE